MIPLPEITLCLIVKNEAENLPIALRNSKLFTRTLVVDTGSTDGTQDIARRLGATVVAFDWCDDFARARNIWLDHVRSGWIFWMDADDSIAEEAVQRTLEIAANAEDDVLGYVYEYLYPNGYVCDHIRLFRADRNIRWRGRIHEHLDFRSSGHGRLLRSGATIVHEGFPTYDPEALERRAQRNNRLLELELKDDPENAIIYQYIAMDHQAHGRHKAAIRWFKDSLKYADPEKDYTWLPEMYVNMARSYARMGESWKGRDILNKGLKIFPKEMPVFIQRHLEMKTPDGRRAEDVGRSRRDLIRALS